MTRPSFALFILFIATTTARAQPPPAKEKDTINTDRPDQCEAPYVMKPGAFQIESGFLFNSFKTEQTALIGMLALRYGLLPRVEIRAIAEEGRNRDYFLENTTQGIYPLAVGAKFALIKKQRGLLPEAALTGWLKLPYTSRSDSQRQVYGPSILLATEHAIGRKWELEANAGYKQDSYDYDHEWMTSVSLHYDLTGRIKLFAEYFSHFQRAEDPVHNADAGVLYLINRNMQLDISAGTTLYAVSEKKNTFGSLGFSVRVE